MTDDEIQWMHRKTVILQHALSMAIGVMHRSTAVMPDDWRKYVNGIADALDEVITTTQADEVA